MRNGVAVSLTFLLLMIAAGGCTDAPTSTQLDEDGAVTTAASTGYDAVFGVFTTPPTVGAASPSAAGGAPPAPPTMPAPFAFSQSFRVPGGGFGFGLEVDGSNLYWYAGNQIRVLDPSDGTVRAMWTVPVTFPSEGGLALAFDGTNLFYSDANFGYPGRIYEVTTSGVEIKSFPAPDNPVTAMTFFNGELYAYVGGWWYEKLYVLDPATGNTKRVFDIEVGDTRRIRGMAAHGNSIIAYDNGDAVFVNIDPRTGSFGRTFALPLSPLNPQFQAVTGMASDGTNLYVLEIDYFFPSNSYVSTYVPRRGPPVGQCPPGFDEVLSGDPLFDSSVDRNNNGRICNKGRATTDDNAR